MTNARNLQTSRQKKKRGKDWVEARTKAGNDSFVALRHALLESPAYQGLSPFARTLLIYLMGQYSGKNNGDLTAAKGCENSLGMSYKSLWGAKKALLDSELVIVTRQGGKNRPTLYALTCFAIDEILDENGASKIDVSPTQKPPDFWRENEPKNHPKNTPKTG